MNRNTKLIIFFLIIISALFYFKFHKNKKINIARENYKNITKKKIIPNIKRTTFQSTNFVDCNQQKMSIERAKPQISTNKAANSPFIDGELILRVSNDAVMKKLQNQLEDKGIIVMRRVDQLGLIRVKLPEGMTAEKAKKILEEIDDIKETLPNVKTKIPKDVSDNPLLNQSGKVIAVADKGNELMKNNDPVARAALGNNVIVALLDTGVSDTHPDLSAQTLPGYNFVDDNIITLDENSHGTACAGIIIGAGKNQENVKGVAPAAYLLPVKVMGENGKGNSFAVIEGIVFAVDRGAKVINLSIGTAADSKILREAIDYATGKGAIIIAAAGNDGKQTTLLPAAYENVICVGAVDGAKNHAPFSNYGEKIDVVAPGVAVYTSAPDGGYKYFSGTSAAAPFVSGAVAALLSENPNMSPADAMVKVLRCADNLGAANKDDIFGNGIVNIKRLLRKSGDDVYDAALTTLYFEPAELEPGSEVKAHFVLQNQGTRTINFAKFLYQLGEEKDEKPIHKLKAGECEEIILPWTVPDSEKRISARIQGYFKISEADDEPDDNGKAVILRNAE